MKRKYIFICVSLLIALFIYLFYRTGKTVVNEIAIRMISLQTYTVLKTHIGRILPLNGIVIYSLPEGLWIFCITLTSKPYYVMFYKWRIDGALIPLVLSIALEILQLLHMAHGRFDFMDIGFSVMFWILGTYLFNDHAEKQNIFTRINRKKLVCVASYCIVYLAHVLK